MVESFQQWYVERLLKDVENFGKIFWPVETVERLWRNCGKNCGKLGKSNERLKSFQQTVESQIVETVENFLIKY